MMSRNSYSEPLRSHMRRRLFRQVLTVGSAGGIAALVAFGGIAIGHAILKTALIATTAPCMGCF